MSVPQVARHRRLGFEDLASASFLRYVATLPWSIAPMSVGLALCGAITGALWIGAAR